MSLSVDKDTVGQRIREAKRSAAETAAAGFDFAPADFADLTAAGFADFAATDFFSAGFFFVHNYTIFLLYKTRAPASVTKTDTGIKAPETV